MNSVTVLVFDPTEEDAWSLIHDGQQIDRQWYDGQEAIAWAKAKLGAKRVFNEELLIQIEGLYGAYDQATAKIAAMKRRARKAERALADRPVQFNMFETEGG